MFDDAKEKGMKENFVPEMMQLRRTDDNPTGAFKAKAPDFDKQKAQIDTFEKNDDSNYKGELYKKKQEYKNKRGNSFTTQATLTSGCFVTQ